jgi:hypothetical protein
VATQPTRWVGRATVGTNTIFTKLPSGVATQPTLVYLIDEGKKEVVAKILSDSLTEVSCDAFFWHIKTYNPEADIPDEAMLKDAMASKDIKMMSQDGLIFGQEFSFYKDENGNRHLTISSDAIDKMKPETFKYINEVTDANL